MRELDPGQSPRIRDAAVANYWPWLWLRKRTEIQVCWRGFKKKAQKTLGFGPHAILCFDTVFCCCRFHTSQTLTDFDRLWHLLNPNYCTVSKPPAISLKKRPEAFRAETLKERCSRLQLRFSSHGAEKPSIKTNRGSLQHLAVASKWRWQLLSAARSGGPAMFGNWPARYAANIG